MSFYLKRTLKQKQKKSFPNMKIRVATSEDIPQMVNLWYELMNYHREHHFAFVAKENNEELLSKDFQERIENPKCCFFLAILNDQVAGFISCSIRIVQNVMVYNKRGYVAETVVGQEFRGKGVGALLFNRAQDWFLEKGADHIELQVSLKNDGAFNFWKSKGFSSTTRHMVKFLK